MIVQGGLVNLVAAIWSIISHHYDSSSSALDLLLVKRGCCSACIFYYLAQKTAQSRSHIETRVIKVIYVHESGDVPIS